MSIKFDIVDASTNGEFIASVNVLDDETGHELGAQRVRMHEPEDLDTVTSAVECEFGPSIAGDFRRVLDEERARERPHKDATPTRPDELPNPIKLDSPQVPPLPEGIFDYWLKDWIDAASESVEVPPELPAAFAIGAISSVLQRAFTVRIKDGYFEPLNVWVLCSMTSGNRKTECCKRAIKPLVEWEEVKAAELLPAIERATSERKTIEARIAKLRANAVKVSSKEDFERQKAEIAEMEASLPLIPKVPRLFTQDATPEHLGTMLADNDERMAIISDEGGPTENMAGRYSNGIPNLDVYLQSHAGSFVRVDRGSRPSVNLKHPALTIAISPQPEVLAGLAAHKGFRGRGLLARFMYMLPTSNLGYRRNDCGPIPDDVAKAYHDGIFALANTAPRMYGDRQIPHVLSFGADAHSIWHAFWADIEAKMRPDGELSQMTDFGGKLPGLVARIAGILHCVAHASCADQVREISGDHAEKAVKFGQYLLAHAVAAFGIMGADPGVEAAKDIWKSVSKRQMAIFTVRDAWHPLRGTYRTVASIEPGFDVLVDHAMIFEKQDDGAPRKGRSPSKTYLVHPALCKGWQR